MDYYMWPGFILWGLDRLMRAGRVFWNTSIWHPNAKEYSQATIEMLSGDTLRMTLKCRASWTAGQHAYVMLPSVSALPTEAHPFTIASAPGALDGSADPVEKDVVFIIRARAGVTYQMLDIAKRGTFRVPAFMDGPYGFPPNLTPFSTVVLVAGQYTFSSNAQIYSQTG
jgi:ferric-chelate reductase